MGHGAEAFFENPNSLYLVAQMAQVNGIAGVGIWALGMDGDSDQAMVSALDGNAPPQKDLLAGPSSTSSSARSGCGGAAGERAPADRLEHRVDHVPADHHAPRRRPPGSHLHLQLLPGPSPPTRTPAPGTGPRRPSCRPSSPAVGAPWWAP